MPFYTCIANHDVPHKAPDGRPAASFDATTDPLGYYTAMHLPLSGPADPVLPTPRVCSNSGLLDQFRNCAGERFPRIANYSFEYGDAHFPALDSDTCVDPTNAALPQYVADDLARTDARWKFVAYHHSASNAGREQYKEQHRRVLSPILEQHGVDIVFHGHEHTYLLTISLRFQTADLFRAADAAYIAILSPLPIPHRSRYRRTIAAPHAGQRAGRRIDHIPPTKAESI